MNSLIKYKILLKEFEFDEIDNAVNKEGIESYLNDLLHYLDCTRLMKDGRRIVQTIDHMYGHDISVFFYVVGKIDDEILKREYLSKLEERHKANLEYEKENPPVVYVKKKTATKSTKTLKEPKEKKPSAKALKAAKKVAKINMLKLNIKK